MTARHGGRWRHLARVVDPDREDRDVEPDLDREERAAHLGRFLTLRAALLPLTKPVPAGDPVTCEETPDPRDHGARTWDALVRLAQHALDTEDGLELSGSAVRRIACDSDLIRVLLDADGCVLDVGRSHRLVTPTIWTALVARDHHCAFPGCSRPPVMCHAHHIRCWINGRPTAPDNPVLLCGHHHRTIHHTPWEVRLADDRRPEFHPPPKPGRPPPGWIRHRPRHE